MTTWLIDISNHQPDFDVAAAVSEGYEAIIMKASEGTTFIDWTFSQHAAATINAGAIPGAYHYLRQGQGREQCDIFMRQIANMGGPNGWLVACDNEADADWDTTVAFFQRWSELTDHPLMMYSGNWWWTERGWNGSSLTPYLWDSRYVNGEGYGSWLYEQVPDDWWQPRYGGWSDTTILQFSSSGLVAGQRVDVNAYRGTRDELLALTRGQPTQPTQPPSEGSSSVDFNEWKNGTIGATPPDWMGGPRDRMRIADWYGAIPGKLNEMHQTGLDTQALANRTQDMCVELLREVAALAVAVNDLKLRVDSLGSGPGVGTGAVVTVESLLEMIANRILAR